MPVDLDYDALDTEQRLVLWLGDVANDHVRLIKLLAAIVDEDYPASSIEEDMNSFFNEDGTFNHAWSYEEVA